MTSLGERADVLPADTVDSLTTAEILYHRYASEEYANKGFDYSSISALYYQAFEAAYNKLIWFDYSNMLNETEVDGQPLIDIMSNRRSFEAHSDCTKYLGADHDTVKKYIRFRSRRLGINDTTFTPYCMYGQFTKIMETVKSGSLVTEFCSHLATLVGFANYSEMLNDSDFMNKCTRFTTDIDNATGDRNNASHGGSYIDINQCKADKKTVLDNLETIRSDSMGLIEQLIGIMTYKKK